MKRQKGLAHFISISYNFSSPCCMPLTVGTILFCLNATDCDYTVLHIRFIRTLLYHRHDFIYLSSFVYIA